MNIEILEDFIYEQQPQWRSETRYPFDHKVARYFNNWYRKLPGSTRRRVLDDETHNQKYLRGNGIELTEREFYERIDAALSQHGISITHVQQLQERMRAEKESNDAFYELMTVVLPAFETLIEEGFTWHDLAA